MMVAGMTSFTVRMLACALGLAFASCADATPRKQRKPAAAAAPTVVTVRPYYWGANLWMPGPIYYSNEYLGTDPDPFIRSQIWRDLDAHFNGGR